MSAWRPSSQTPVARSRAALLDRARMHFYAQNVLAVDTPALSQYGCSDPEIESFSVRAASGAEYFLHTSPEFCMKRLLAAGYPDIYSICRVYRDGEAGKQHLPEFTMIEWYRLNHDLGGITADATTLIARCLDQPTLLDDVDTFDYGDAFATFAGIDVFDIDNEQLADCVAADSELRDSIGDDSDAWLDLILSSVVAPKFRKERLTVLKHYPANKAALARLCPRDYRVADRFEVFFGATELANGYVELTDADEQRRRIEQELQKRRAASRITPPWDRYLLQALESGLPDCAGVAVGVERMQMVHDQTDDIAAVVTFR